MTATITDLRPPPAQVRDAAHEAIRDACDLIGLLNMAAQHPNSVTDGDKDAMRYRLGQLNKSVRRITHD